MKRLLVLAIGLILPAFSAMAEDNSKTGRLNDAEIAHIVVTANGVDIEAGNLAKEKASHKDVHAYAQRVVSDHTDVNEKAMDLVTRLNVTPKDNATSKGLKAESKKNLEKLNGLSGDKFDKAYIDDEIKLHKQVIHVVDSKLVPNVKNEELKALLVKVRPSLVSHLEHAQQIRASLGSKR